MRRRRNVEAFSLSFLDCICCGFGAIILLLVLSKIYEPVVVEESENNLQKLIALLQEELFEIRGTTTVLDRELKEVKEQTRATKSTLASLEGDLSKIQGQYNASKQNEDETIDVGELQAARQRLSEEQRRLQPYYRRPNEDAVAGIPVDSEYVIFVIDTSGSMQERSWRLAQRKIQETLEAYPAVKGIQVMNDDGNYMFREYTARWMPDSPGRRQAIVNRMRNWTVMSDSNPVDGIEAAIRDFRAVDKKISIYVFGDDFQGGRTIDGAVAEIDRLNRPGPDGDQLVRIHGVGFPGRFGTTSVPNTAQRFATFMRVVCAKNGGTFVALSGN